VDGAAVSAFPLPRLLRWCPPLVAAVLPVLVLAGCGGGGEKDLDALVPEVPADTLAAWLDRGEPVTVLDVRADSLFEAAHVPGSIRAYGLGASDLRDVFPSDPAGPMVVLGDSTTAPQAARLVLDARKLGYTGTRRLHGGIAAWRERGYTLDGSRSFAIPR
jgi:rhodanese-related sulfurtransferase